jgi:LysM repeat protein
VDRSRFTHWAAPVAFLAAITIGALVVRAGFQHGKHPRSNQPTTTVKAKTKKHHRPGHQARRTYVVQSGDTLGAIAAKTGTTVARLLQLNPGINPTALRVGQRIRVK